MLIQMGFLDGSSKEKKKSACNAEVAGVTGLIPGLRRSPEKEMNGNTLQCLAWGIQWTEEPGGLQSMGSQKSQTQLSN